MGGGCVHWVRAMGCGNSVAWNVGPSTALQMEMAIRAYDWNRLNAHPSPVPMQHLCWQIARSVHFTDPELHHLVKGVLLRSLAYARNVFDYAEVALKSKTPFQSRTKSQGAHYCDDCQVRS